MALAARYYGTIAGLILNVIGAGLLIFAFEATGTDLKMVVQKDHSPAALCAYGVAFISWVPTATGKGGAPECPTNRGDVRPIAGVVFEHGSLIPWGFGITVLGTLIQMLCLERPPSAKPTASEDEEVTGLPDSLRSLAAQSVNAAMVRRVQEFADQVRRIMSELAQKNIVGGPTLSLLERAAVTECEARVDLVATELQRSAESIGQKYYIKLGDNLCDEFDRLMKVRTADITKRGSEQLRVVPNASAAIQRYESTLALIPGTPRAHADLRHFAESLRTKERRGAEHRRSNFTYAVAGAIAGSIVTWAIPALLQLLHH